MNLKRKHKRTIIVGLLLIFLLSAGLIYKTLYKPHVSIEDRELKFTGNTSELLKRVQENPSSWQDVAVQLSGTVTETEAEGFSLDHSIYCQLDSTSTHQKITLGDAISIKGRVIGYDDLLEELKLDQTIIITD